MVYPLHQIVCKGGYFTFEFKKDKFVVEEYITFKYNKYANNFLLHRLGCINLSMDKENPYRETVLIADAAMIPFTVAVAMTPSTVGKALIYCSVKMATIY